MPKSNKPLAKPSQLLTKKRAEWAKVRTYTGAMRGSPLNYPAGVQIKYTKQLDALVKRMTTETRKELVRFFKGETAREFIGSAQDAYPGERRAKKRAGARAAQDATISSQARILTNNLTKKFDQLFALNAKPMAEKMASGAAQSSKSQLHASLSELSGGLSLKTDILTGELDEVVNATVVENVALIRSISAQYLAGVQGAVMRSITTGQGLATLVPYLAEQEGVTLRRARNIAIDQTRKAYNNINRQRMQKVGVKQFEWLHTGGSQKPRKLHQQMSGNIYRFDDLPIIDEKTGERGIPGQLINCGCRMVPVISFDDGDPVDNPTERTDEIDDEE